VLGAAPEAARALNVTLLDPPLQPAATAIAARTVVMAANSFAFMHGSFRRPSELRR
jgi:hypothetical protein